MNFGSVLPCEMCPRSVNSLLRVCELLSRWMLTISNFLFLYFLCSLCFHKDGPIKLFCRVCSSLSVLSVCPVSPWVTLCRDIPISVEPLHLLCVCGEARCWLAVVVPALPCFSWIYRRGYGPLGRHPGLQAPCSFPLGPRTVSGFIFIVGSQGLSSGRVLDWSWAGEKAPPHKGKLGAGHPLCLGPGCLHGTPPLPTPPPARTQPLSRARTLGARCTWSPNDPSSADTSPFPNSSGSRTAFLKRTFFLPVLWSQAYS